MKKIRLGKTNLMVSRLGFGGIPIQRVSDDEAMVVIGRCLDLGINFFDTANSYGKSEEHIGRAIAGQRKELILSTKSHAQNNAELESHIRQSLKSLGTDYIDLYQFHNINQFETLNTIIAPGGPLSMLQEAKKTGLVNHIGFSSHQIDVAKKAVEIDLFETVQFPLNFITSELGEELRLLAREHDMGFIAMKPLAGGRLENVTLAFKYLLQFPNVVPIPGIQRVAEIEEIIQVLEGPRSMTEAERAEMQRLRQELGNSFCRRCDYCQPCPAKIPIALVLDIKSMMKKTHPARFFSDTTTSRLEKAADCTDCGDCEEKCPYHLPIRDIMVENLSLYQTAKREYLEQIS